MRFLRLAEVVDELDHVDDSDALERARTSPPLRFALEISRPANWHGTGLKPDEILRMARESGIPVAWVPPAEVLRALVQGDPGERMTILGLHESEILDHCRELLADCDDSWIQDEQYLMGRALSAYEGGFHEAAMALAVAVGEPLALWASIPRGQASDSIGAIEDFAKLKKYQRARIEFESKAAEADARLANYNVLRQALIAPIPSFFTPFHGDPGEAVPEALSRHVTVHRPTSRHLSGENALLAIMLGTSILRDQQAWAEEVRFEEASQGSDWT